MLENECTKKQYGSNNAQETTLEKMDGSKINNMFVNYI